MYEYSRGDLIIQLTYLVDVLVLCEEYCTYVHRYHKRELLPCCLVPLAVGFGPALR